MFPVPKLFRLIQEESKTNWKEMYQVFNCGHRFEIYAAKDIRRYYFKLLNLMLRLKLLEELNRQMKKN